MPEMSFTVEWPDGQLDNCYSPSLVMHDHLEAGHSYPLADFVARTRTALQQASDRVLVKYGMRCTSAMETLAIIERRAAAQTDPRSTVRVIQMEPPLPRTTAPPAQTGATS